MPVKLIKGESMLYPQATCPVLFEVELIRKKWMLPLLLELFSSELPLRFSFLQRTLNPITPKLLTQRLSELERQGFVTRTEKGVNEVEYSVTRKSEGLRNLLGVLKRNCLVYSKAARVRCSSCVERDRCVAAYGV